MSFRAPAEAIRSLARDAGFALCRFAQVSPAPNAEAFNAWLASGAHATMRYLERTRHLRANPALLVSGARSVIVLGVPYLPGPGPLPTWREELRGRVAAYARGVDYHDILRERLQTLCARIRSFWSGAVCHSWVDSGPVLERDWAWTSGVGWFGRNTNILHQRYGSGLFLAVVVTNLEIEPDAPVPARCGRCVRCIPACPTGALDGHYRLDSRLCISYWTIEHRGPIPRELRPAIGEWVFGCDLCQDVCPWNQKRLRAGETDYPSELYPFLPDLLCLTEDGFRARYRRTALWRAKREGIARNAAVVLGNSHNPDAVPWLQRALVGDPSPVVRGHAAWALGQIGTNQAYDALRASRMHEVAEDVIEEIDRALARCESGSERADPTPPSSGASLGVRTPK